MPSLIFRIFALCTQVTLFLLFARAYAKASRMMRVLALRVIILVACTVSASICSSTPTYKSSVFSRKVTISTFSNGVLTAVLDFAGRIFAYKSYLFLSVTFRERNPLPIGVVIGAFNRIRFFSKDANAASGISFPLRSYSASPTAKHS